MLYFKKNYGLHALYLLEPWICGALFCFWSIIASDASSSGSLLILTPIALRSYLFDHVTINRVLAFMVFIALESMLVFNNPYIMPLCVGALLLFSFCIAHYVSKKYLLIMGYMATLLFLERCVNTYFGTHTLYTFLKIISIIIVLILSLKWFPFVKRGNRF